MNDECVVILLKELVILPNQEIKIELVTDLSKKIADEACENYINRLLVVAPLNPKESNPSFNDLPKIGVVALIKSKYVLPNGNARITLLGEKRVIVKSYFYSQSEDEVLKAHTLQLKLPKFNKTEESAALRKLKENTKVYVTLNKTSSNAIINQIQTLDSLDEITDAVAKELPFDVQKKLEYMQMINPLVRCQSLIEDLKEEIEIIKLEMRIDEKVHAKMMKNETDFFLKEKLEVLQEELGIENTKISEVKKFKTLLKKAKLNEKSHKKLLSEINKYSLTNKETPDANLLYNYLDTVLNLPWQNSSEEFLNSEIIKKVLDTSHFGMEIVKERIMDYADVKKLGSNALSPVICLVGAPGVGKTSIASNIATSLNREFVKISVGGLNDSIELTGSRKTYLGSSYGKIIDGIKKSGVNNPVILIDEVDKMLKDHKSDPASILLEVLDPNENKNFTDAYIEEPFDLSKVLFILTANYEDDIPYILKDRLEIINIPSYAFYEKEEIALKYLLPKIYAEYNCKSELIDKSVVNYVINNYTDEAGVRELTRALSKLVRKMVIHNIKQITKDDVITYLKEFTMYTDSIYKTDVLGVVNALACTNTGGLVSNIETVKTAGSGSFKITGNTEKVMDESVEVALSYIKTKHNINTSESDFHIHFLEGGVHKAGPSAGVAITTALLSLYLNKVVSLKVAFTGEITLNGKIVAVGSVREKIIAAINQKMDTVYIPLENKKDCAFIKTDTNTKIVFVSDYEEIYEDLFK